MRLNPDCIRDILLTAEENIQYKDNQLISMCYSNNPTNFERLKKYSNEEIRYHIIQCGQHNFIQISATTYETILIRDLTPLGHEFLTNIRSNTVWNKTISIANKLGSTSLDVLIKIATGVLTQMINKQLGY
ncbi:MAG: DUF2513 domain-containing protein [Clostridium perfringens]|nr:DUF2513 domain-containing protein [Clostridium perfringens]MDU3843634.1 DUF2513 domain-containing protein [Clostridium perfringens]